MIKSNTAAKLLSIASGIIKIILVGFSLVSLMALGKWFDAEFIVGWIILAVSLPMNGLYLLISKKPTIFLPSLVLELVAGLVTTLKSAQWVFFYSNPAVITSIAVVVSVLFALAPFIYSVLLHKTENPKRKALLARLFVIPLAFHVFSMFVAYLLSVFTDDNYFMLLIPFLLIHACSNAIIYLGIFVKYGAIGELLNKIRARKRFKKQ